VRSVLPREARDILSNGAFCYVAASTRSGPHVTPVVFALDGGRIWLTTSRGSAKARAWKVDERAAGMVRHVDRAVVFRGRVKSYDALDPFRWPAMAFASPRLGRAATKFSVRNARFFFGYAVDAYRVPLAWAPPGRVFTAVEITAGRVLDLRAREVVEGWGDWPRGLEVSPTFVASAGAGTDEARRATQVRERIPARIRRAMGSRGEGVFSTQVETADGMRLTVLPVTWRHAGGWYEATAVRAFAELTEAGGQVATTLTIDRASAWRAAEMRGVMFRGIAYAYTPSAATKGSAALRRRVSDDEVLFRLRPGRATWWEGWSSGTAAPAPSREDAVAAAGARR
jgi:hypothetical protein